MIYETFCWNCKKDFGYEGEQYRDVICPHCKILNSVFSPFTKESEPIEPEEQEEEEVKIRLSDYIKADVDVKQGDIIVINDEGIEQENENFTNDDGTPKIDHIFKIVLADGEERKISMNKTSLKKFVEKYGNETKEWVGKKAIVNVIMNPNGKKGIVLDPQ